MKRLLAFALTVALTTNATASRILWAALDESSKIDNIAFREYANESGLFVNSARLSIDNSGSSSYSVDSVTQLALWIPPFEGDPGYWEEDFPMTCLHDDDGDWYMGEWSSQFNLGENPNTSATVFFELGYVDLNDDTAPFITLATANASVQSLIDGNYTYMAGTIYPPTEQNWMPTQFTTVPEPSSVILAMIGVLLLLKRRKR